MKVSALMLAIALAFPGCVAKKTVVPEQVPAKGVVIDVPGTVVTVPEKNDPEGKLPVPPEAAPGPDGEASPKDPAGAPVNDGEGEEDAVTCAAEPNPILPGSILVRPGGKFEVLGLSSAVAVNWKGYTTYHTTVHGVEYRIIKEGVRKSTDPLPGAGGASPTPTPGNVEGDFQKDPNTFATSKNPLGVDNIVKSGRLTAEQIQSIQMDNILKLFTYKNPNGLSPGYHKDMAYMLQRFIAEGYLHGVNVIPIIKAQSHKLVLQVRKISEISPQPLGLASGETVSFATSFWTTAPFYSRLRTFYHELGHALFEREHMCGTTLMHAPFCNTARPYPRGTNYDPLIDETYSFKSTWKVWKPLEGGAKKNCPLSGC